MNKYFQPGDIITNTYGSSFCIYEGRHIPSHSGVDRYSLLVYYNPNRYQRARDGWSYDEFLDFAEDGHEVEFKITTNVENSTYRLCTQFERERFKAILERFGYVWNDEKMALERIEDRNVISKIEPIKEVAYDGEIIAPRNKEASETLSSLLKTLKPKTYYYDDDTYGYGRSFY